MSITTPSRGTHASDGFRSGPLLQTQYSVSANPNIFPSTQLSSPVDTQPPGVFNTPLALLDIIPTPVSAAVISPAAATAALPFVTVNGQGITLLPFVNGLSKLPSGASIYLKGATTTVVQLDVPRNLTYTSSADDHLKHVTTLGWDLYGQPMTEQTTLTNTSVAVGKKAFYYIKSVTVSAAPAGTVSAGVGNVFGLPYFCPSTNYFGAIMYNNAIDSGPLFVPVALGAGPLTTTLGSATVLVAVASTAGMSIGQTIILSGLADSGGIVAANLNITATITALVANTSFSYTSNGVGGVGAGAGQGGAAGFYQLVNYLGTVTVADQHTATATTGDVRGTYTPSTNADGVKKLTINFYAPSADARKYNDSSNSAGVILNSSPFSSTAASAVVNVLAPNHQLTGGELVTISGATSTDATLLAANLNLSNVPVTIVDQNNFTFTATATATTTATYPAGIGGAVVVLSPSKGNLYQLPVGRFGVQQF